MAPADAALPLRVSGLWVHYDGAEAVRGISFDVEPGEVVALVGANGAGKTTVLRAITGLHPATEGTIRYGDLDLTRLKAHQIIQQGIAHVPEGRRLFYRMTVRENLQIGMYQRWSSGTAGIERAFELFPELEPFVDRRCFMLSGGQQQMVAVARALLPEPKLLLLDEPSLGLAPFVVRRILDVIEKMRELGTSVVLVEQDTSIALEMSDRALVISNGAVVAAGSADEVAQSDVLQDAYLGGAASAIPGNDTR